MDSNQPLASIPEEDNKQSLPLLVEDVVKRQREFRNSLALPNTRTRRGRKSRMADRFFDCVNCGGPSEKSEVKKNFIVEDRIDAVNSIPLGAQSDIQHHDHSTVISSFLERRHSEGDKAKRFDVNLYAAKKSAANGLMDLALLMANASQLKHVLMSDGQHRFYIIMLTLIISSITLQILIGISLLVLARWRIAEVMDSEEVLKSTRRANVINNVVVSSILLLTVLNVFISAFGLDEAKKK